MSVFSTHNPSKAAFDMHLHPLVAAVREVLRPWRSNALSALALLAGLSSGAAEANTLHVNASCTLIDAITSANSDSAAGGCNAGSGADIIVLPAGSTQTLTVINNGSNGLPLITSKITINGNGSTVTRSSDAGIPAFRIFEVASSGDLTLNSTTISRGKETASEVIGEGGGINNFGTLSLNNCTVSENDSQANGAGVNNNGTLMISNSSVSGNHTGSFGGGVNNTGRLIISNSEISNNWSTLTGAGVNNTGTLTISNSTVSRNYALSEDFSSGGVGIRNTGTLTLTNSSVVKNTIDFMSAGSGAGIYNSGKATVTNSTVSKNSSYFGPGGGIFNSGTIALNNTTITENWAVYSFSSGVYSEGHVAFSCSLVSGNRGFGAQEVVSQGTISVDNYNLFGQNSYAGVTGFTPGTTDIIPTQKIDAILKPLAANGGPSQTYLLRRGSPAIDARPHDAHCASQDQRGVTRPRKSAGDIGAVEVTFCETAIPTTGCIVNGVGGQVCRGAVGADTIIGTSGDDIILGLGGDDLLQGKGGNDKLCGGVGNDRLEGSGGSDVLDGSFGNDTLSGGDGDDKLFGEQGNDILSGGTGADTLNGGQGSKDTCISDADDTSKVGCEL